MAPQNVEMITQRTRIAWDLEATFDANLEHAITGYDAYLAPALQEGETLPDCRHQLLLLKQRVVLHREELQGLTGDIWDGVNETDQLGINLNTVVADFLGKMRTVRHSCHGLFGPEVVRATGLRGAFSRVPDRLYHKGLLVKSSLENADPDWKARIVAAAEGEEAKPLKPSDLAKHLDPELGRLEVFVSSRFQGNRSVQDLKALRRLAVEDFDRNIRGVVRIASGIMRVAGRLDAADRFRATLRYLNRRVSTSTVEDVVAPTPDAPVEPDTPHEPSADSTP